jgi:hypothetical protein
MRPKIAHCLGPGTCLGDIPCWHQLSYLLQSGRDDPPTFLTWKLRTVPGGTMLRLQVDEIEGSSDDDAEDTWLPVLAALHALLDPASSRAKPATGEQAGPTSAAPII